MKPMHILMLASIALTAPAISHAQVAGTTVLGVSVAEMREVAKGVEASSAQFLVQPVYNEKDESVGSVDDIIIAPDKAISYAIVNAGGFLGLARHDVAIPVSQFKGGGAGRVRSRVVSLSRSRFLLFSSRAPSSLPSCAPPPPPSLPPLPPVSTFPRLVRHRQCRWLTAIARQRDDTTPGAMGGLKPWYYLPSPWRGVTQC